MEWHVATRASGERRLRSTVGGDEGVVVETPLPSEMSPFGLSVASLFAMGCPLFTQRKMAIIVKLAATNMALGRYVPMLTKRFFCMRR